MNKPIALTWAAALALAAAGASLGLSAHPKAWGLYVQLPGIAAGLLAGYFADSRSAVLTKMLVVGTTIVVNGLYYYWLYRLVTFMRRRTAARSSF